MFHKLHMFADKEKSLQLKRVSSSPRIGVSQQAAVPCESVQGMAISPHTRNTGYQVTDHRLCNQDIDLDSEMST